jgi:ABC-type nitrate/sulfonate/bicarbonate transport system substrate-binding protein
VLRRVLLAHGLDFDKGDYTLVPAGATGYRFESMEKGETFAAVLNPPWNERALEAGMTAFGDHREVLPDYPGGVYAVSKSWAAENHDAVVGFVRALAGAVAWLHDPATADLAARRVAAEDGGTPEAVAAGFARQTKDLTIPVAGLEIVLHLRVRFGLTPPMGPDLASYLDTSFVDEALGR